MKIIKVFTHGDECCEHNFIYSGIVGTTFSMPPTHYMKRICKECGRYDEITDDTIPNDINLELFKIYKSKFNLN